MAQHFDPNRVLQSKSVFDQWVFWVGFPKLSLVLAQFYFHQIDHRKELFVFHIQLNQSADAAIRLVRPLQQIIEWVKNSPAFLSLNGSLGWIDVDIDAFAVAIRQVLRFLVQPNCDGTAVKRNDRFIVVVHSIFYRAPFFRSLLSV